MPFHEVKREEKAKLKREIRGLRGEGRREKRN